MEWVTEQGYTITKEIGSGGEGHVYLCEKNGKTMILKVVPELNEGQVEILYRVNNIKSPYFPQINEIINDAGNTYILREYIEGNTLREELKKNGSFSYNRAKQIFFELCTALDTLHNAKPEPIIHRDLKPENIIITPQGNVRLIDFGIARSFKPDSVRDTVLAGTDGYTAPEVRTGFQSDRRSDIYSLGILLYEMLCGKGILEPPFQVRPLHESNPFLPKELDDIIYKAVDPQQIVRYQNAVEFRAAVEAIQVEKPRRSRKPLLCFIYGVLTALALLIVSIFLFQLYRGTFHADIYNRDYSGRNIDEVCTELIDSNIYPTVYSTISSEYEEGIIMSQTQKGNGGIEFQVCIGPETERVSFEDPELEQAVRDTLGISPDKTISSELIAMLVELNAQDRAITSLNGLEYAVNLTNLQISHNSVSDLSPIENLGRLTELKINYNRVSELSCLSRLKNLKILHFENNQIVDISVLKGVDLYDLEMGGNSILDISPISECENVVALSIHSNRISDLSPLAGMKNLSRLLAGGNLIANIEVLSEFTSLTYLDVEGNRISDLSPVAMCQKLSYLNCASNYITDISPLVELSYLSHLRIDSNELMDISKLSTLQELTILELRDTGLSDYLPLLGFKNLKEVIIDRESHEEFADVFERLSATGVSITYTD